MLKKNIENIPDIARNITTFAVRRERILKIESRTSGEAARVSITTNETRSTAAIAKKPSVTVEVQPAVSALTIA